MTPHDEQGQVRDGWSVLWIFSCKAEAACLVLGVSQQAGLVRPKDRYGIRVSREDYGQVFRKLALQAFPHACKDQ